MTITEDRVEPKADAPLVSDGHVMRLRCTDCCDKGWRQVTDEYAHRHAARSHEDRPSTYDPDHNRADYERFIAFRETYLPCVIHQPSMHQHWAGGHLDSNHHCEECGR